MSKTRGLQEVLVDIDECRRNHSIGFMIQPLRSSGFCRYSCAGSGRSSGPWHRIAGGTRRQNRGLNLPARKHAALCRDAATWAKSCLANADEVVAGDLFKPNTQDHHKHEYAMNAKLLLLALASLLIGQPGRAQTNEPAVEDFKPSSLNQPGKQYPQVNSERRVRARVVAPLATNVGLQFLGGATYPLTKGDEGAWVGVTRPQDEGFHYYQLVIDGAGVPDPGSLYFYGGSRWGSGVEVPAKDQDFYALKNVPHGDLRQTLYSSKSANATLRCFVYTPPDYEKDPSKRYPVL